MAEKLISLERWGRVKYGDDVPFIGTLRRWVREGKIYPPPKKHGRSYFLSENAEYVNDYNEGSFMEKVIVASQTQ
jgi:hypothetical protein